MIHTQWHILGPGAIGSLFAWHLAEAGFEVHLIGRSPQEDARLIRIQEPDAATHSSQTRAFTTDHSDHPIQRLLVTVKAHQTHSALKAIQHRITPETLIVLLQNGMGTREITRQLFAHTRCLVATTTEGAHRGQEHRLIHAGRGCTWLGAMTAKDQPDAEHLHRQWQNLALDIELDPHIQQRLWYKLAINCAINPLTVLYNCENGKLLEIPQALAQMEAVCSEISPVMAAELNQPPPTDLFERVQEVAWKTGRNLSSMLLDARLGRETELEFITGYLVATANKHKLPCGANREILECLRGKRS